MRRTTALRRRKAASKASLLFDPGDKWEYGSNIDWCGQVIEAIAGKRLGEVFKTRIFDPLGMHETSFRRQPVPLWRLESIERGRRGEGRIIDAGPDSINPLTCEPCSH